MASVWHLAKRFFGSLAPGGPPAADESWACGWLTEPEAALWGRMSGPDRRHAVGVAKVVAAADAQRPLVAAALLHDVGKIDAGLGTFGRVVATVLDRREGDGRFARYRRHDAIGAALLEAAGSDPLVVAWAAEHHTPAERWSVPHAAGELLKRADDD